MTVDRPAIFDLLSPAEIVMLLAIDPSFTLPHTKDAHRRMYAARSLLLAFAISQDGRFSPLRIPPIGAERVETPTASKRHRRSA